MSEWLRKLKEGKKEIPAAEKVEVLEKSEEKNSTSESHPIKNTPSKKNVVKTNLSVLKNNNDISIDAKRGFYYFHTGKVNRKLTSEQLDRENRKILDPKEFAKTMRNIFDYLENIEEE